ncbi:MAG: hypothetical protein CMG55_04805 [Candidatus Marinimicrobia bacterium]|nr:hypothetical protein [Candidatus Neomarinimicrobiota bacterium]|tara:strand:- start:1226 stop:2782 length:1557 start_codon:yes stop_codon:yes gene_type:complete
MLIKNKNSFFVFLGSLVFGLILLNLTARDIFHRFDLTDNKMFSLSNSSKSIVEKLDDRLTIKVYFSDNLPNELGNTRRYLQDILEEYRAVSKDINFYFYDPESDSELEEQARKDGIQPVQMQSLENDQMVVKKVYLGMVLLYEDKKETLPVIQTTAGLEYMISTKLKSLINLDKKTIGLLSLSEDVESKNENLSAQLREHYNFRNLQKNNSIPDNIDVLLISGATDTLDSTIYNGITNFLNSGKKLLLAQSGVSTDLQTQQATPIQSNIFELLKKYRLNLQKNLVLDGKCGKVTVQVRQGPFLIPYPMDYPFFPIIDTFDDTLLIVSDLEMVRPLFPSEIQIDTLDNNLVKNVTPLFTSSNNSGIMEMNLNLSPDPQQNPFINMLGQKSKVLAATSKLSNGGELLLVSDSKFLSDDAGMSVNENMIFLMNVVDYLAGDQDLISLRSREVTSRPLNILQLDPADEQRYSQDEKDRMKDKIKKRWKFANMVLPSALIIGFGVFRLRREKNEAEVLKQIYD